MKKVLMIAHQFPPAGGPGVQRTSKFVKYLECFGYESIIVTRDEKNMPLGDRTLLKDVPKETKICRLKAFDVNRFSGMFGKGIRYLASKILIPDVERPWQVFGTRQMHKIINGEKIDVLYTTSMPYSSHLAGLKLKEKNPDIPWVADFRDEWTNNPYILDNPHSKLRMRIERNMEKNVLKKADALITNTPIMLENFLKNNKDLDLKNKFFVIPNGFDESDFIDKLNLYSKGYKFTMTYTGSFYGRRKPDTFIMAIKNAIEKKFIDKKNIKIQFSGNYNMSKITKLIKNNGLSDIFEISGYVPHEKCVEMMIKSDCLILIEGGGIGANAFYTGKVFEYMATKRPILGVIPKSGGAAKLIKETNTGLVSDFDDVKNTAKNIKLLYNAWKNDENILNPNKSEIEKYKRKNLTKELANIFEYVLS